MDKAAVRAFKGDICQIFTSKKKKGIIAKITGITETSAILESNRKGAILISDIEKIIQLPQWKEFEVKALWEKEKTNQVSQWDELQKQKKISKKKGKSK